MTLQQAKSRQRQIMAEIANVGFCLPGSLVERTTRCGNAGCGCRNDPARRHGPYPTWTRRVGGKTVTKTLSTEQAKRYRPFFDNSRHLRALIDELEDLSVQVVTEAEGWGTQVER